ncbi:MAG: alkaline phosphatase D family protein [Myxococcales bacterium]|nr:alkaline phosphatase D family protein [Myxococcales bacterium]
MDEGGDRGLGWTRRAWLRGAAAASLLGACDGAMRPAIPFEPRVPWIDGGVPFPTLRPRTFAPFEHGVASGDPLPDGVILWTRVTPGGPDEVPPERVEVGWEVATDPRFDAIVVAGTTRTDGSRDFTVKLDVRGLAPATTYYYRFGALDTVSPTGRTRTAPDGPVDRLRFAVASCASLGHGFFHAYEAIAQRSDLDAVIHLGDYLYEYPSGFYGTRRALVPPHELLGIEHYRARYAQYRREPPLAEAHRQHPWIVTWDDHETANDAWREGAENHDPENEGGWAARLAAATRAYREWMPLRDGDDPRRLWRSFVYGDLCEIAVLDTRTWGRDMQTWTPGDPVLDDPARELLGVDQHAWLFERLRAAEARWKVIAQQVMIAPLRDFAAVDGWSGYPRARERLLKGIADEGIADVVVLTGDVHSSWAMDLPIDPFDPVGYDPVTGDGAVAVEIVAPAVTSPGLPDEASAARFVESNPHLFWAELHARGFVVLDLAESRVQADWFLVGDVEDELDDEETHAASFVVTRGRSHLEPALSAAPPRPGAPPLVD